jgi:hypothetical protein
LWISRHILYGHHGVADFPLIILSYVWVTIHGFWIDDRIYWTLWYSAWIHFTVHTLVSTVGSSLPLLGSGFQRRIFPFLWVPELPASYSNSSQCLNRSSPVTNSLIHQPTDCLQTLSRLTLSINLSCYNTSARTA